MQRVTIQFDADLDSDAYHQALTACEIAANVAARTHTDNNAGQVDVHEEEDGWRATMLLEGPDKEPWVGVVPMTQKDMNAYLAYEEGSSEEA